jgi:hypothetical protein
MKDRKRRMKCSVCGSYNVNRDAWAVWDENEQDWVLRTVFDAGYCDDCARETRIDEEPAV